MRRRYLIALLAFLVMAGVCAIFLLVVPGSREPEYEGKPLSFWSEGYGIGPDGKNVDRPKANEAVHKIGTNGIPTLLRLLHKHDTMSGVRLKLKLVRYARNVGLKIKYNPAPNVAAEAGTALRALGPQAAGAVPALIKMYDEGDCYRCQAVAGILGYIGPAANAAIPSLLRGVANTDAFVRSNALFALGAIHADPGQVVPVLIKSLTDTDQLARQNAIHGLGQFGPAARRAIPTLVQLMKGTHDDMKFRIEMALRDIGPDQTGEASGK
jgi:hypothetical protein